jgi:diaminopimelate decarboxylase
MTESNSTTDTSESKCCGTCGCRATCAVTPKFDETISRVLQDKKFLFNLVNSKSSPLNIVIPDTAVQNHRNFEQVLKDSSINGRVLFTSKPNKSKGVLSALSLEGASVDVSSEEAMKNALACGIRGENIQSSGPKSLDYIYLSLCQGSIISVDSPAELEHISNLMSQNKNLPKAKIFLRICGFESERVSFTPSDAPFGIAVSNIDATLSRCLELADKIDLLGIHFHLLSGYKEERLIAFENALTILQRATLLGLSPKIINIGGGFKVRYAADLGEWQKFQSYLKQSVLGKVQPITWDGSGLGFRAEAGRIAGAPVFADHFPSDYGSSEFSSFLKQRSPLFDDCTVGELVRDLMVELWIEPGRAILDQVGVTLAEVRGVKESAAGQPLIMLGMNNSNLMSRENKLLTQPIFIPKVQRAQSTKSFYLFGNLCIASDLIQYQKVYPGFVPEPGDLVAFVNTAAYHQDFVESEILHQRRAEKVCIFLNNNEVISIDDERCSPAKVLQLRGQEELN